MVGKSRVALLMLGLLLAGCATPAANGPDVDSETSDEAARPETAPVVDTLRDGQVQGPSWKPGFTWSLTQEAGGLFGSAQWATETVLASGIAIDGTSYGLIVRRDSDSGVAPQPEPESADAYGVFHDGAPGIRGFDPADYDCEHPRFCFDDAAFQKMAAAPTEDPPFPLARGQTWLRDLDLDGVAIHVNGTALGLHDVTVPAGTFEAMQVHVEETADFGSSTMTLVIDEDYAPDAQMWVHRSITAGGRPGGIQEKLLSYDLTERPGIDLVHLGHVLRPLNITATPDGPLNAAKTPTVKLQVTGGVGHSELILRDAGFNLEGTSETGELSFTANRTGTWLAYAFDDGHGYAHHVVEVGLQADATLTCDPPAPVGSGYCTAYDIPVGWGSQTLHAWANATLAPLGGTLEVIDPDGVVAASSSSDGAAASIASHLDTPGVWSVRWTPAVPIPTDVALHVVVGTVAPWPAGFAAATAPQSIPSSRAPGMAAHPSWGAPWPNGPSN